MRQKLLNFSSLAAGFAEAQAIVLSGAAYQNADTAPCLAGFEGSRRLATTCHLFQTCKGRPALKSMPVSHVQMLCYQSCFNPDQVVSVPR